MKCEENKLLRISKHRLEDISEMDFKEIGCGDGI
jgi:hypothetical protein